MVGLEMGALRPGRAFGNNYEGTKGAYAWGWFLEEFGDLFGGGVHLNHTCTEAACVAGYAMCAHGRV